MFYVRIILWPVPKAFYQIHIPNLRQASQVASWFRGGLGRVVTRLDLLHIRTLLLSRKPRHTSSLKSGPQERMHPNLSAYLSTKVALQAILILDLDHNSHPEGPVAL